MRRSAGLLLSIYGLPGCEPASFMLVETECDHTALRSLIFPFEGIGFGAFPPLL